MRKLLIILLLPTLLLARQKTKLTHPGVDIPYEPWFTGTALSPTAINMELGHPGIQPFFTVFNNYGRYNDNWKYKNQETVWTLNYLVDFQFATTKRTGVEIIASFSANYQGNKTSTHFTDTILLLGYQVSDDKKDSWIPDFRLAFETIFPSGNFRQLKPENKGLDKTGQGAYFFGPSFAFQKLFYFENSFLVLHWSFGYFFPTLARVRDVSAYAGGPGTRGTIRPGQLLSAFLSFEYSFNQRWVFSWDTFLIHQQKARDFRGKTIFPVFNPTTTQISIVPALEYNFSPNTGLIFGSWLTLAGRNADAFASAFLSLTHIF